MEPLIITHEASVKHNTPANHPEFNELLCPSDHTEPGFGHIPEGHKALDPKFTSYFKKEASWSQGKCKEKDKVIRHPTNLATLFHILQVDDVKEAATHLTKEKLPIGLAILPGLQCPKFPGRPLYCQQFTLEDDGSARLTSCQRHAANVDLCPFSPSFKAQPKSQLFPIQLSIIQRAVEHVKADIPSGPIYKHLIQPHMIMPAFRANLQIYELQDGDTWRIDQTNLTAYREIWGAEEDEVENPDERTGAAGPSATSGSSTATSVKRKAGPLPTTDSASTSKRPKAAVPRTRGTFGGLLMNHPSSLAGSSSKPALTIARPVSPVSRSIASSSRPPASSSKAQAVDPQTQSEDSDNANEGGGNEVDSEPKQKRKDLSQWTQAGKGYWGMMLDEHEARMARMKQHPARGSSSASVVSSPHAEHDVGAKTTVNVDSQESSSSSERAGTKVIEPTAQNPFDFGAALKSLEEKH